MISSASVKQLGNDGYSQGILSPPPYENGEDENLKLVISAHTSTHNVPQHPSQLVSITTYTFSDARGGRRRFSAAVPKKREGWKAQIDYITEKERQERRYEVRREPLSRRFDLRDADGNHNVLIPTSSINQKSYSLEAPDGQRLLWRKTNNSWDLLSLPSQALIARYTMTISSPKLGEGSSSSRPSGSLEIIKMPSSTITPLSLIDTNKLQRTDSSRSDSSSSSEGPRLGSVYKRLAVGLCAPAAIAASVASPYATAGMNKNCTIGDELSNLGRVSINAPAKSTMNHQRNASASSWIQMNMPSSNLKSNDPRPRKVDLDLIISTFIAVVAG